jgi:hypothetical protein
MKFHYLRSVGAAYKGENEQPIEIRSCHGVWSKIETDLKAVIMTMRTLRREADNFQIEARASVDGRPKKVSDSMKFFTGAADRAKAMQATQAKIDNYREWLRREGVSADANGKVKLPLEKTLVHYDKDLEKQGMTRVTAESGKLYIGTGAAKKLLDTSSMVSHQSGPGYAIYVMSAEGHIHLGSHVVGLYHHSSLLGGEPVAGAGEIIVTQGKLNFVSNKSGHFVPEAVHFNQVLRVLEKMQQHQCTVKYWYEEPNYDGTGKIVKQSDFAGVLDYRNSFMPGEKSEYQLAKLLTYTRIFFNEKNELNPKIAAQGWRWADAKKDEPFGFYDKDGNPVAHCTVRKFIKANLIGNDGPPEPDVSLQGPPMVGDYVDAAAIPVPTTGNVPTADNYVVPTAANYVVPTAPNYVVPTAPNYVVPTTGNVPAADNYVEVV